jgi:predicted phage-related endonuclease
MLATVDYGLAARGNRGAPVTALLEVKTTQERIYKRKWIGDKPPPAIILQCHQQLAVTGYQTAWVTCMRRDTGRMAPLYRVERSQKVIDQIIDYAGTWWAEHIEGRVRPEPVLRDLDRLAGLYPADETLEPLPVTAELAAAIEAVSHARRLAKVAAADERAAKFIIEAALSEGHTAITDAAGDVLATWKQQTVRRWDTSALAADHPELAEQYRPAKTSRGPLLIMKED